MLSKTRIWPVSGFTICISVSIFSAGLLLQLRCRLPLRERSRRRTFSRHLFENTNSIRRHHLPECHLYIRLHNTHFSEERPDFDCPKKTDWRHRTWHEAFTTNKNIQNLLRLIHRIKSLECDAAFCRSVMPSAMRHLTSNRIGCTADYNNIQLISEGHSHMARNGLACAVEWLSPSRSTWCAL
jgi:hypothetical protein